MIQTNRTPGTYYTVTRSLVAKGAPAPPKFTTLDKLQDIGGVKLASGNRTFATEKIGEQMGFAEDAVVTWLPEGTVDLAVPE